MKRAAVIGLGDISGIHLAAIAKNPEITLAAVFDIDESTPEITQRVRGCSILYRLSGDGGEGETRCGSCMPATLSSCAGI